MLVENQSKERKGAQSMWYSPYSAPATDVSHAGVAGQAGEASVLRSKVVAEQDLERGRGRGAERLAAG